MNRALLFAHRVADPVRSMTGIGRYVVGITSGLAALDGGWRYEIVATREEHAPRWLPPGVGYAPVRGPRRAVHLAWMTAGRPRLERFTGRAELVHALHPSFPIPTTLPSVVTIHDLMPIEHPGWYDPVERTGYRRAIERIARERWSVIAVSQYVADALGRVGIDPELVTVVHEAVGDEFRTPVPHERLDSVCARVGVTRGSYLLAVGNLSTRKNLVTLVEAMAEVANHTVPLVVAGRPHTSADEVMGAIDRLGARERVRLAGFVPDADLPALIGGARALVHPSVDEGFGLPPLEAMATGTPAIVARAGSLPEIVGDAALLVEPHDVAAWTAAIDAIVDDDALHARLRDAGRARAACFTWARAARETRAVHESVVGAP